jgi:hypothetical protein
MRRLLIALALCCLAWSVGAAIRSGVVPVSSGGGSGAWVQGILGPDGTLTSTATFTGPTLALAVSSGNRLCGGVWERDGTGFTSAITITGITDDKSNTYQIIDSAPNSTSTGRLTTFCAFNITNGPKTLTFTASAAAVRWRVIQDEFHGLPVGPVQHSINGQTTPGGGTDAITSGAIVPTVNGEVIYGVVQLNGANTASPLQPGTGFVIAETGNFQTDQTPMASEWLLQGTAASKAATFTGDATGTVYNTAVLSLGNALPCTIAAVSLSNNTFSPGVANTTVGTISATKTGACAGDSFSLTGTDAAKFQLVGTTLETNGSQSAGTYNINLVDTISGATGSPFSQPETLTATSCTITAVSLSNAAFSSGVSNAIVGTISATKTGTCGSDVFTLTGTDAAKFQIVSGTTLETNGSQAAGSYSVNVVDTTSP